MPASEDSEEAGKLWELFFSGLSGTTLEIYLQRTGFTVKTLNRQCSSVILSGSTQLCALFSTDSFLSCSVASDSLQPHRLYSLPGSSVHGIFQVRILEWVAIPSSRGSSRSRDWTCISYTSSLAGGFFTASATWESHILLSLPKILTLL